VPDDAGVVTHAGHGVFPRAAPVQHGRCRVESPGACDGMPMKRRGGAARTTVVRPTPPLPDSTGTTSRRSGASSKRAARRTGRPEAACRRRSSPHGVRLSLIGIIRSLIRFSGCSDCRTAQFAVPLRPSCRSDRHTAEITAPLGLLHCPDHRTTQTAALPRSTAPAEDRRHCSNCRTAQIAILPRSSRLLRPSRCPETPATPPQSLAPTLSHASTTMRLYTFYH